MSGHAADLNDAGCACLLYSSPGSSSLDWGSPKAVATTSSFGRTPPCNEVISCSGILQTRRFYVVFLTRACIKQIHSNESGLTWGDSPVPVSEPGGVTAWDSSRSPEAGTASMQNMQTHLFWSFLSHIDIILSSVAWLSTGNVKGLMDGGHRMANVLGLGCVQETDATEVLNFHIHPFIPCKIFFRKQIILSKVLL